MTNSKRLEKLKITAKELPTDPGVYLMKNQQERIIYVGKAKNLKSRVQSYFTKNKDHSKKTKVLVKNIDHIDYILTETESEAFLLEASLIKKHKPKYNVRLKDDKAYPYIKLSMGDRFPRLYLSRKVSKDKSFYYGPFTSGLAVRETIKFLNQTFLLRDCSDSYMKSRKRPCMTHQIGRCTAPCVEYITEQDYAKDIASVKQFLKGRSKKLISDITKKMKQASKEERFEIAARHRDSIKALEHIIEKQAVINANSQTDQDIIALYGDTKGTCLECLHIRQGRLIGKQGHFFQSLDYENSNNEEIREALCSFVIQYYEFNIIPDELLLPMDIGGDLVHLMQELLKSRAKKKVFVRFPTDEESRKLQHMAETNAKESFKKFITKRAEKEIGLEEIQRKFQLKTLPNRIECFDISNFQGKQIVASQVVFEDGVPAKEHYRRYRMKSVKEQNDFASMKEVLERRLKHKEYEDPDLIVIDGGKGQLSMAVEILKELYREDLAVVGLAKARTKSGFREQEVEVTEERFYLPGRSNPVIFRTNSAAFHILVGIRDEAHRFAIVYHRKLRDKSSIESELDYIVGLGQKRKKALLQHFDSVEAIRAANPEDIAKLKGFNEVLAQRILLQMNEEEE